MPLRRFTCRGGSSFRPKRRLSALAEWHFGGGADYCGACAGVCEDCPNLINQPETYEGAQLWDLVLRMGGQVRAESGVILGWDMGAALAMGSALGVPELLVADVLPDIEAIAITALNRKDGGSDG